MVKKRGKFSRVPKRTMLRKETLSFQTFFSVMYSRPQSKLTMLDLFAASSLQKKYDCQQQAALTSDDFVCNWDMFSKKHHCKHRNHAVAWRVFDF